MDFIKELMSLTSVVEIEEAVVVNENKTDKVNVYHSTKTMGQLGDIFIIDATKNVTKLALSLGIKAGWNAPVKIGNLYASLNAGDRLVFFSDKNDYDEDEIKG